MSATGSAISNGECDVNGDDSDDAVVGAWGWDKVENNVGAAYVLLGGAAVKGGSLGDPGGAGAVRIEGYEAGANSGMAVACLGDLNGDSYDDIGIGDFANNRAFVIFGAADFTGLSLNALGDRGFIVKENFTTLSKSNFGTGVNAVGDLNDDGFDDFAVTAVVADTQGRSKNGRAWIIAGRDDISDVNVSAPAAGDVLLSVDGALDGERLGAIAQAGDVNGDGTDDFVMGSYTSTPWGSSVAVPGAAYVVFGGNTGNIDLLSLDDKGFKIFGPKRQRDRLGTSVSSAGDVDGDGKADLLIGGDGVSNAVTGPRNGGAAVVLGSASTATVYTDPVATYGQSVFTCPADETPATCVTPTRRGYWINGAVSGDSTAYSAAGIGDVDGDGVPDFALGAYGFDPVNPAAPATTMSGAGATYVVYGRTTGAVQELSALTSADGFRIDGLKTSDRFGRQVGLIGDFDGNGVRDLVVGADQVSQTDSSRNGLLTVALMGKLVTSTSVTGPSAVAPTDAATFTATVAKKAGAQTPLADGTVSFSVDGTGLAGCSAVPVASGAATCVAEFGEERTGEVVATFNGTSTLQPSHAAAPLSVVKTVTTTSLKSSVSDPRAGQLVQLQASITDPALAPIDAGTVTFLSDGKAIAGCKAVEVSVGDAICTTAWSSRAEPEVTAEYAGTVARAASESGALTLVVGSNAVIKPVTAPALTYGTAPAAITGEIRGEGDLATGTVEMREGSTLLARTNVEFGEYALNLGATALAPGSHTLTLVYSGDAKNRASERNIAVSVAKATSTLGVTRSRGTLKGGQRLTVKIAISAKGVAPMGKVQVKLGSKVVKTLTLKNGKARYKMSKFASKGTKKVSVVYVGSDTVNGAAKTVKVVQK